MPKLPAHQVTTRNLGAAYPFIAEAGLGQRGVVIGDDLLGGSFVFDPFELYAAGVVSNPNMVVFGQIGRGKSSFVKTFLWRQAVFGRRAWVVDPKGEYGDLADAWGVRPVALRPGGAIRLNPLDRGPETGATAQGGAGPEGSEGTDATAPADGAVWLRSPVRVSGASLAPRSAPPSERPWPTPWRCTTTRLCLRSSRRFWPQARRRQERCGPNGATCSRTGATSPSSYGGWCTATSPGCSTAQRRRASTSPLRWSFSTSRRSTRRRRSASSWRAPRRGCRLH